MTMLDSAHDANLRQLPPRPGAINAAVRRVDPRSTGSFMAWINQKSPPILEDAGARSASAVAGGYLRDVSFRPAPRDLRASDADRERVMTMLAEAVSDGRLTPEEHEERLTAATSARTLGELAGLT
ncbi:MAG TPA: DUF1707 domain-containing protein, partial [Streptosporangiaceae bacterium]|nr:DUF1707 domain-containing protein [Streptosporangiaceae bacterium]